MGVTSWILALWGRQEPAAGWEQPQEWDELAAAFQDWWETMDRILASDPLVHRADLTRGSWLECRWWPSPSDRRRPPRIQAHDLIGGSDPVELQAWWDGECPRVCAIRVGAAMNPGPGPWVSHLAGRVRRETEALEARGRAILDARLERAQARDRQAAEDLERARGALSGVYDGTES